MSRHRNVRSMNYNDEYDGYDDIYGHSVEDDYSISPSDEAEFMYDRTRQPQMSAFFNEGEDITEEDEGTTDGEPQRRDSSNYKWPRLSNTDEARLRSCLEEVRNVVGDCMPEHLLVETILGCNFDVHLALDQVLQHSQSANNLASVSAAGDPKPQRQRRERNRERDDFDDDCFFDVRHRIPVSNLLKQKLQTLQIRNNINWNLSNNLFSICDGSVIRLSKRHERFPQCTKTIANHLVESVSVNNYEEHIKRILNRLNVVASKESNDKCLVDSRFSSKNIMECDGRMSVDNYATDQEVREPPRLSIPKFQMKIRRDSDKENDQNLLHSSPKMESNVEECSPPSSDDEDGGGLSSLSALAKRHHRMGSEEKSDPSSRTIPAPAGVLGLKAGLGVVEDPGGTLDENSDKCFNSLADLIASHLSTNDYPPNSLKKPLAFPSFSDSFQNEESSDNGSYSSLPEADDVVIDLTCALKATVAKLEQDSDVTSETEEASPIFLDFEEMQAVSSPEARRLSCHLSASDILVQTFPLREHEPSAFGKILCRKWKRLPVPRVLHRSKSVITIKPFAFNCPSPDDPILMMRQRK